MGVDKSLARTAVIGTGPIGAGPIDAGPLNGTGDRTRFMLLDAPSKHRRCLLDRRRP